ncbi:MAG: hypothetical protein V2A34_12035, partial [Lentisphaerota bacterium]
TLYRRVTLPLTLMFCTTWVVYVFYVVQFNHWMIKTKYILFLLPIYLLYMLFGLGWLRRKLPRPITAAIYGLLVLLLVFTNLYLFEFATGK